MVIMESSLTDEEIYQKAKKRIKQENDYNIIVALEKEIDCYRSKIKSIEETYSDDGSLWFKLKQNTNSEELYKFIFSYLPFGEVVNLYNLLSKNFKDNYIDEIHKHRDERLYDAINKLGGKKNEEGSLYQY